MRLLSISTGTHGRVAVRDAGDPQAVVVGFHGYMETAEVMRDRLIALPGSDRWTLISIQGLHRFYRGRSKDTVASWMTRQDREEMIADNIEYASRAIESAAPPGVPLFTAGFSQGGAMAFRAGVLGRRRARGIICVGADVPPELLQDPAGRFPAALLIRGARDDWYTTGKLAADVAALRARDAAVEPLEIDAGHEWTADVSHAAAGFVERLTR